MQDEKIVALYWQRDESAIQLTQQKYARYLSKIAYNILANWQDSEESVNETYLRAWRSMPPHRPTVLSTYLGRITRQIAIDLFRRRNSQKRRPSEYVLALEELEQCVSAGDVTAQQVDQNLLARSISDYLRTVPAENRAVFLCRYYFMDPIGEIAARYGMTQSKVKSMLYRMRIGLRAFLDQEGVQL